MAIKPLSMNFVLIFEKKPQPIRTLYKINTLFGLDNFGVLVQNYTLSTAKLSNQNNVFKTFDKSLMNAGHITIF